MKIEIELPNDVWAVKIVLPEQRYCREHESLDLFYSKTEAEAYLNKECRRIMNNFLDDKRYNVLRYNVMSDSEEFTFDAMTDSGCQLCLRGYIYKKYIR